MVASPAGQKTARRAKRRRRGDGLRGSILAETPTRWGRLAFGPFVRYWNISRSEPATITVGGTPVATGFEPANHTLEAGLAVKLHF